MMIKKLLFLFWVLISSWQVFAGTYLVEFKRPLNKTQIKKISQNKSIESIELFDNYPSDYYSRLYQIEAKDKAVLEKISSVVKIEQPFQVHSNSLISPTVTPLSSDPLSQMQWALKNNGHQILESLTDIRSRVIQGVKGMDLNIGRPGQFDKQMKKDPIVAVLDYGIDDEHDDLKEAIYKNLAECDEQGLIRFPTKGDKDGNGLEGDCMGWDFTDGKKGSARPLDDHGHGTHAAGIIAARIDNGKGVAGVSNRIKILPLKVIRKIESNSGPSELSLSHLVAKGILYAVKMKADVINMSLGWPAVLDGDHIRKAVQEAYNQGVILVAAAGNNRSDSPIFPCAYPEVVCVGAHSVDGKISGFSNYGAHVDLLAPGEKIISTYPKIMDTPFRVTGYKIVNGTSQAAPYVSALAAVMKGLHPEWTPKDVLGRLLKSARLVSSSGSVLTGNAQLLPALNLSQVDEVFPRIKDYNDIIINPDLEGVLKIKLSSFSAEELSSVPVTINSLNKDIQIEDQKLNLSFKAFEDQVIEFKFKVKSLDSDSKANFELNVGQRSYNLSYNIIYKLQLENEQTRTYLFDSSVKASEIAIVTPNETMIRMRTVNQYFQDGSMPEYYSPKPLPKSQGPGLSITLLRSREGLFFPSTFDLKGIERLLSFLKVDLNGDGKDDYFIHTLATKKVNGADKKVIRYYYLDHNLKTIAGPFDHEPIYQVILNYKQMGFRNYRIKGKILALPVFYSVGKMPPIDQIKTVWENYREDKGGHLYKFVPRSSNELELRVLDNDYVRRDLIKQLNLKWYQDIEVEGINFQDKKAFKNGEFSFHLKIGRGHTKDFYLMKYKGDKWQIQPIQTQGKTIEGHIRMPLMLIEKDQVNSFGPVVLAAPLLDNFIQFMAFDKNDATKIKYSFGQYREREQDSILGLTAAFQKNDTLWSVFETKGNLLINEQSQQKQKTYTRSIDRVSFLNGQLFSEVFYPITVGRPGHFRPGLYVDSTKLTSGHISVIDFNSQSGPQSKIRNNLFIPKNCQGLNPVTFNDGQYFSLLCAQGFGLKVKLSLLYWPIR